MLRRHLTLWLFLLWCALVYGAHRIGSWVIVGVGFGQCGIGVGLSGGFWAGLFAPALFAVALPVYYVTIHRLGHLRSWPALLGYAGAAPLVVFLVWLALTTRTEGGGTVEDDGGLVLARLVECLK